MDKDCKFFQNIELQDILICDKCKKNNFLIKEDVPITDNISSQNKKENVSNIYEYNQIQRENLKNRSYNCRIKCLKFILAFLIINWITIYIYFSHFQLQKEKDKIKRKLYFEGIEIDIKVKASVRDTYILNDSFHLEPNKILEIDPNNKTTICEKSINYIIQIEDTRNIIKLIFEFNDSNIDINFDNMFYGCKNITGINITGKNYPQIKSSSQMFKNCNSLTSVNFTFLDFRELETMEEMFSNCNSLKTMNLSCLYSTKVKSTKGMFKCCNSLTLVNFSKTYFKHLETTESMFENCSNLHSIQCFEKDSDKLIKMENTFQEDTSLISLNLIKMNTQNLENIIYKSIFHELKN